MGTLSGNFIWTVCDTDICFILPTDTGGEEEFEQEADHLVAWTNELDEDAL